MDTRFLHTLVTVVESGSIAEASRILNMSATGVARRLQALENEIGTPLVVRSGKVVSPTKAAISIVASARSVIATVHDMKTLATSSELAGELRLFVIQTCMPGMLPPILGRFVPAHPAVKLTIQRGNSIQAYASVVEGSVDAAITSEPTHPIPKSLGWIVLRDEPYIVIVPQALRGRDARSILETEPFIRLDRKVYAGQVIDRYLRRSKIHPHELFELDGLEAIVSLVNAGLGVTILPDWQPPWPEGLRLRKIPLPGRSPRRKLGLLWSSSSIRRNLIAALVKVVREVGS